MFVSKKMKQEIFNIVKKALHYVSVFFITLLMIYILIPIFSFGTLYVSYKGSIIELGKLTHIDIKKVNKLQFWIGHSDSSDHPKMDNFKIKFKQNEYQNIWFQVINNDNEDVYSNVKVVLDFNVGESLGQIEVIIPETEREKFWHKFKDGYFNGKLKDEIEPEQATQLYSLQFKFKKNGIYPFACTISADGYRPRRYKKHFIVQE